MTKIRIFLLTGILVFAATACNVQLLTAQPTPTMVVILEPTTPPRKSSIPASEAGVPRVSAEEAKVAFESGAAIIVDVRSQPAYEASHVAGAINIQLGEFETNINGLTLDKNQWIITYCT